jgi:hypothetical protein
MKWAYAISHKQTAALLLAIIFLIVGGINVLDRNTIDTLEDSFSSVYEDRLLAESYIYKLSDHLYKKKLMMETSENSWKEFTQEMELHNLAINAIIIDYEQTRLTPSEEIYFRDFKNNVNEIVRREHAVLQHEDPKLIAEKTADPFVAAFTNLQHLSDIQVSEGRWLNENSKRIMAGSDALTQLELAMLICIGLIIQVLIFASRSIVSRIPEKPSLN